MNQQSHNDLALLDEEFLAQLLSMPERTLFARVISLDINEYPIEQIEGRVSGGSINIDGTSAVRRTCSLTMVSNDVNITDFHWGLRSKFKLEIGVQNNLINLEYIPKETVYPSIVWFPCGTFILNSFNISKNTNSCNISLSGKDKMCMLNGELGGALNAKTDFGKEEKIDKNYNEVDFQDKYPENSEILMNNNYYYKDDNNYIKINVPNQLFQRVENFTYSKSKYYYKPFDEQDYYQLDNAISSSTGRTYYELKTLYIEDEVLTINKINLYKIITEALHTYAQEPYHNIIINDLNKYGLEQLTYKGDKPVYIFYKDNNDKIDEDQCNLAFSDNLPANIVAILENNDSPFTFLQLNDLTNISNSGCSSILIGDEKYYVSKINLGDDIGYRLTDLTYSGDLILSAGEPLTSLLDKIKNMLGDFEYFYDLDGRFIFQRKRTYVNTSWSHIVNNEDEIYTTYANAESKFSFNFEGNRIVTALTNAPVLNNVKNDFTVWGKKTTVNGVEIPIHARFAIDKKPTFYKNLAGDIFITKNYIHIDKDYEQSDEEKIITVDWRELIYQMALDYFKLGLNDEADLLYQISQNNKNYYPSGKTGYEQYYTDLQGFWRLLYNPNYKPKKIDSGEYIEKIVPVSVSNSIYYKKEKEWVDTSTYEDPEYYYLKENNDNNQFAVDEQDSKLWWNVNVFNDPTALLFWFDFLDQGEELSQFSVAQIGVRQKVNNNDKASAICFKNVPNIILMDKTSMNNLNYNAIKQEFSGYQFINLRQGLSNYFSISTKGTSVKTEIDNLIYQHGYCAENITITALPVYHLQPNTRIYVCDKDTSINGEYIVTRLTIPLTYNGTMNITANKAPERLV